MQDRAANQEPPAPTSHGSSAQPPQRVWRDASLLCWASLILLLLATVWCYWRTIDGLWHDWQGDDNYSVGQLVPVAAIYLLWQDRKAWCASAMAPCWWGVAIILAAQLARSLGLLFIFESAERYALVLTIIGVVLLIGGRTLFHHWRWVLLFLFLMVPLPGKIHNLVSGPLQNLATSGAVFSLELLGVTVMRQGNVIVLNDSVPMAVAEACSGLRMLTAFVVVGSVLAYVVSRPRWQKAVLVLSTVPIAILCNLIRLVVTAELFLVVGSETGKVFFHDFAGFTMMPLAIAMLLGELWFMSKLLIEDVSRVQHFPA